MKTLWGIHFFSGKKISGKKVETVLMLPLNKRPILLEKHFLKKMALVTLCVL